MKDDEAPDPGTAKQQGRDGGNQNPGDEVLHGESTEVAEVLASLQQGDDDLEDAE